jgi:uncharacterized protein DUF3606
MYAAEISQDQALSPFILLCNASEIEQWCLMLRCTEEELHDAIACAGPALDAIELHLLYKRMTRKL